MTDRNGKALAVGDRVFVLPRKRGEPCGGGYVRAIVPGVNGSKARVDDGDEQDATSESCEWMAWVKSERLEKI